MKSWSRSCARKRTCETNNMPFAHAQKERGYILLFILIAGSILIMFASSIVGYATLNARVERHSVAKVQALSLAEAGVDKAVYELNRNGSYTGETLTLGNGAFTVSIETIDASNKRITATGYVPNNTDPTAISTVKVNASIDTSVVSFGFGLQAGEGGVLLENTSSVRGNIYSNGPVRGANSNIVRGDVVSASPSGLIDDIHATSSAYAHTITDSRIDRDAYFQSISGTIVGGTSYPGSTDQATSTLPISDSLVEEWKAAAEAGGVHTSPCPYTISSSVTIGPLKINCDLTIQGSPIITLNGPIWVHGDINIQNSPTIRIDPSQGGKSIPVIADYPADRLNSSTIIMQNSPVFQGSGSPGSYVLFISQNNSAENAGSNEALTVKNYTSGAVLVYAGHGEVVLENNVSLKEVAGWKIHAKNSAQIIYETGLGSVLFTSGPGGSWTVVPGTYAITD